MEQKLGCAACSYATAFRLVFPSLKVQKIPSLYLSIVVFQVGPIERDKIKSIIFKRILIDSEMQFFYSLTCGGMNELVCLERHKEASQ